MADSPQQNPFCGNHGPLLIAEIGGNHEGNFDYAQRLTELAIESGADYVKFQLYRGDTLVSPAEAPDRNAHFKKFELTQEQHLQLAAQCASTGVGYMASVWDLEMLDWIDAHLPIYKIGSGDLTAYPVIREFALRGKPIILSTGLATLNEVLDSVAFLQDVNPRYKSPDSLALLQCTSMYPIEDKDANIRVMDSLRQRTGLTVGYSDHTIGSLALLTAAARGAQILEFHFTDEREGKTFRDHKVSLTRDEVLDLCGQLDRIRDMLGDGIKRPLPCEVESGHVTSFRRGVYCSKRLLAGELVQHQDLVVLRPNHGIDARRYDDLSGEKAAHDIPAFAALELVDSPQLQLARCPLCSSQNTTPLLRLRRRPEVEVDYKIPEEEYDRTVVKCGECSVYFNNHSILPESFYSGHYNQSSYSDRFKSRYRHIVQLPFDRSDNKHRAARVFDELRNHLPLPSQRVLDVGMGLCVFLAEMKRHGCECHGIDPDADSVSHALNEVGIDTAHCGTLSSLSSKNGPYHLITFNKVLEHVTDPVHELFSALPYLAPGGLIYVELPDGDLALSRGTIQTRAEFNVEHLFVFNSPSLKLLAQQVGLEVLRIESLVEPSGKCTLFAFLRLPVK
jgi:N-acetylneuraminate synthase/N,N'-diacetyllegionaminate synthase